MTPFHVIHFYGRGHEPKFPFSSCTLNDPILVGIRKNTFNKTLQVSHTLLKHSRKYGMGHEGQFFIYRTFYTCLKTDIFHYRIIKEY